MKTLQYTISIDASAETVWETMLGKETYLKWANAAWPGSQVEGEWQEGAEMRFLGEGGGGTMARILTVEPHRYVFAKHIAVVMEDGALDYGTSEMSRDWVGSTEAYTLTERDGSTDVLVEISTAPEWAPMFDETWPTALAALKELAEA